MVMSAMTPTRSVTRSATTMGAVRSASMPRMEASTTDLNISPTLPGVTVSTNPERKTSRLSDHGKRRAPFASCRKSSTPR